VPHLSRLDVYLELVPKACAIVFIIVITEAEGVTLHSTAHSMAMVITQWICRVSTDSLDPPYSVSSRK
jgi:hypothetical protein